VSISVANISVSERWPTPYAPPGVGSRASSKKIREGVHVRIGFIQIGGFGMAGGRGGDDARSTGLCTAPPYGGEPIK
jgi:hypothetical protein